MNMRGSDMARTNAGAADRRRYYSRYIAHYTKKNSGLLALGALFLTGVVLGALLIRTASRETVELLLQMVGGFVDNRRGQTLLQNFLSGTVSSLVFLAIPFVCGFCAVAQPVVALLPLFRGLGVGFSTASLYAAHGTGAIGFVALLMLPDAVASMLALLVCCRESLRLSGSFFAAMGSGDRPGREFYPLRIYFARYFACAALCVASAFLQAALYFGFANFFVFH